MTFGQRLKLVMDKADIKAYGLYMATSISQSTIGNYLKDSQNPSKVNIKAISDYFNIEYGWLKDGIGNSPENISIPVKTSSKSENIKEYNHPNEIKTIEDSSSCKNCILLKRELEMKVAMIKLQDKLIAEYEIQLGKKKNSSCG